VTIPVCCKTGKLNEWSQYCTIIVAQAAMQLNANHTLLNCMHDYTQWHSLTLCEFVICEKEVGIWKSRKWNSDSEIGNRNRKRKARKNVPSSYTAFLFTAAAERMRIFIGALYT